MAISVNLWSRKKGELKNFLERYYQKKVKVDDDVNQWIYVYRNPIDAIDIIGIVIDNSDKYSISICIQIDDHDVHPVTYDNHNDIIKSISYLYYQQSPEVTHNS